MPVGSPAARSARIGALVAGLTICLGLGVLGLGHGSPRAENLDTRFLFLAGKYWLAGLNAYLPTQAIDAGPLGDVYDRYVMGYPPQSAPLFMFIALGSIGLGGALMDALNLAAIAVLSWVAVATIEETVEPSVADGQRWYVPALVAGNLSTAFVVWTGQTTLIVIAALAACWYCARRGRDVAAGVLLAIATIKPPLTLFVVLWFVLARRWRLLAAMTVAVLVASVVPMYVVGPVGAWRAWLAAVAHYAAAPQNLLESRMVFNLRVLLLASGLRVPDLTAVGLAATLLLFAFRSRIAERDVLGLLVGAGLLFGYGHSYDLAALVVLIPSFWRLLRDRPVAIGVALALLVGITFPNSVLEPLGEVLVHTRVVLVVATLVWLVVESAAERRAAGGTYAQLDEAPETVPPRWLPSTSRMP